MREREEILDLAEGGAWRRAPASGQATHIFEQDRKETRSEKLEEVASRPQSYTPLPVKSFSYCARCVVAGIALKAALQIVPVPAAS